TQRQPAPRPPRGRLLSRLRQSPVVLFLSSSYFRTYRHLLVSKHSAPDLNTFAYLNYVIGLRDPVQEVSLLGGTKSKILHELRERDQTARDVAARLRVQVSAARKHHERVRERGRDEDVCMSRGACGAAVGD